MVYKNVTLWIFKWLKWPATSGITWWSIIFLLIPFDSQGMKLYVWLKMCAECAKIMHVWCKSLLSRHFIFDSNMKTFSRVERFHSWSAQPDSSKILRQNSWWYPRSQDGWPSAWKWFLGRLIWIRTWIRGLAWEIDVGHNNNSTCLAVFLDVFVTCLHLFPLPHTHVRGTFEL